jgi:hypothetical protein
MLGLMLLTSKGAAGVTGSGFVALVATLTVMPDLPVAGVALIVGIDRFMSERARSRARSATRSPASSSRSGRRPATARCWRANSGKAMPAQKRHSRTVRICPLPTFGRRACRPAVNLH